MNAITQSLASRAYEKFMGGNRITRDEELALDMQGFEEKERFQKDEERLGFLNDPNKSKFMAPYEKRYETSKIWGQRRGGPVAFLAGGLPTRQSGRRYE
jgi:hypothetical protein